MPDVYVRIPKPTDATWTKVNVAEGKEQYDQADIIYDDPLVFYDGTNENAYTKVAKPVSIETTVTIRVGMATGLLIPLTYATPHTFIMDDWTRVNKPIT